MGLKDKLKKFDNYKFRPLTLSEENVDIIFNDCLASESTSKEDIFLEILTMKKYGFEEDSNPIFMDRKKLDLNRKKIQYMLGQLKHVHTSKDLKFHLDESPYDYKDKVWTTNPNSISKLIVLGTAANLLFGLNKRNNEVFFDLQAGKNIPTLSSQDPNFPAWWEEHKAEWED